MALPAHLRNTFTPNELEFAAENEWIDIVPRFEMDRVRIIGAKKGEKTVGPFKPLSKTSVPIWMAITLKKRRKCRIVWPEWLTVDSLESFLQRETGGAEFSALPFRYIEISRLLLDAWVTCLTSSRSHPIRFSALNTSQTLIVPFLPSSAADDIPPVLPTAVPNNSSSSSTTATSSINMTPSDRVRQLLKNLREARLYKMREGLNNLDGPSLKVLNISSLELNEIRPFLTQAFKRAGQLDPEKSLENDLAYTSIGQDVQYRRPEDQEQLLGLPPSSSMDMGGFDPLGGGIGGRGGLMDDSQSLLDSQSQQLGSSPPLRRLGQQQQQQQPRDSGLGRSESMDVDDDNGWGE